ncbi:LytTR family DNA-binding domain-containing protein [Paraflavitalea sp. CAU 1676]|uniref:LytR/AlgR family response regulator transcription factor n=1 Tax=Paraflavitalea sp. CAU 1676 TaxID=3032598 RepID=UPI0023DBDC19|nr:LytTR family DNA-binding domain-containing protein [Paraflavitalea sp. CAU 1676]MDF2190516.1 LytTR family DNA-binding domain-containing protein [Paraflavitalea sp. CAU 1676]
MQNKVLIIENEWIIRKELELAITSNFPQLTVVGSCGDVDEAISLINSNNPDILLLDINLTSNRTAFDLLDLVPRASTLRIIFLTAFEEYGIRAIKYGALDYLLKPISIPELKSAFQKALLADQRILATNQKSTEEDSVTLNSQNFTKTIQVSEISHCIGKGSYTTFILFTGEKIMVSGNIKKYEDLLLHRTDFARPHKSCIVNRRAIDYYDKSGFFILKDRSQIPVSGYRKDEILNFYKGGNNENS